MTTSADRPERPPGVPASAWWSPADNEWILGPKDDADQLHGEVQYWRPDGSLCCISQLRHGTPHGPFQRFHETGEVSQTGQHEGGQLHGLRSFFAATGPSTEDMYAGGRLSSEVARIELDYDHGTFRSTRYYDRDGVRLGTDGKPLPIRPEGVPAHAIHSPKTGNWLVGTWQGEGRREGLFEMFRADGTRLASEHCRGGVAHGPATLFYRDGTTRTTLEYADGVHDGVVEQFYRTGGLARRAYLEAGGWAGSLTDWGPNGESIAEHIIAPPEPAAIPTKPAEAVLLGELSPEVLATLLGRPISPCGVACLLALGWGGDDDRDASLARAARRLVRTLDDAPLADALRRTGLDTAPRLLTPSRVERVLAAMRAVDAVDAEALVFTLASCGGVGRSSMLAREDAAGVAALREHIRDERLDLNGRGLDQLPRTIRQFPTLRIINANRNRFRSIPRELADVVFLCELSLRDNQLTTLPAELARLRDLWSLSLAHNPLQSLPEVVPELVELSSLDLSNSELSSLPESFAQLQRLRTLWLQGNPLRELPESFAQLSSLSFLHLGGHSWSTPPPVLYELPALRQLWIASDRLTELPEAIGRLTKLEHLIIWGSQLTSLPDALFEMTSLRELRVRNNPLPTDTLDRLKEALPDCTIY